MMDFIVRPCIVPKRATDTPAQCARIAFFLCLSVRFAHVYQAVSPEGGDDSSFKCFINVSVKVFVVRLGFLSVHPVAEKRRLLT